MLELRNTKEVRKKNRVALSRNVRIIPQLVEESARLKYSSHEKPLSEINECSNQENTFCSKQALLKYKVPS